MPNMVNNCPAKVLRQSEGKCYGDLLTNATVLLNLPKPLVGNTLPDLTLKHGLLWLLCVFLVSHGNQPVPVRHGYGALWHSLNLDIKVKLCPSARSRAQ